MRPIVLAALTMGLVGCSTAALHPELVAKASGVRIVRDAEAVRGCAFLQAISGTEEAGYTTTRGLPIDPGTPAITVLQLKALDAGADTVEITSSGESYRAGVSRDGGRAHTLTTLTGNAYRCGAVQRRVSPSAPAQPGSEDRRGGWRSETWEQESVKMVGILVAARDSNSFLHFGCLSTSAGTRLAAALGATQPFRRETNDDTTVQLRFDDQVAIPIVLFVSGKVDSFAEFYNADVLQLKNALRMHDKLLAQIWFKDGSSDVLEFDVQGFDAAARQAIARCSSP